jgi:hypothetical protein
MGALRDLAVPGGATAILAWVVVWVYVGRLIPLRSHLRELAEVRRQADEWRETARLERTRADEMATQLVQILDAIKSLRGIS